MDYSKISYRTSFRNISIGICQLGICIATSIANHKALTALVISVILNIYLVGIVAAERTQRDASSKKMWEIECENDSLKMSNVKYYNF